MSYLMHSLFDCQNSLANGITTIITKDKDFLKIEKISPLRIKLIK